jgi:fibronectin-binding autotransporter adhesin
VHACRLTLNAITDKTKLPRPTPYMKTTLRIVKLLLVFACSVFSTAAFGQVTQIWTAGGDGTNIDQAANWGGTLPGTGNSDIAEFNGLTTSNLFLINNGVQFSSGPGLSGINVYLTGNQTNSVNISTTLALSQGFAVWNTTLDPGAGPFSYGSTNPAIVFYMPQRPSGQIHTYLNNSSNTATINPYIRYISGGGAAYTFDFIGSGNWQVNNNLQPDNGGGAVSIQVDGPGTTTWNPTGYFGSDSLGSITINGGALVLTAPHAKVTGRPITINGGAFQFNAPAQAQTLTGVISGSGTNILTAGTLTLSGANGYTGDTVLAGGELIANRTENPGSSGPLGVNNTIDFNGGILGYSVNNTFDYSSRFSTAPGQAYKIDTAGQLVTYASALTSSGGSLTKNGAGTLTLSGANTYSGPTTVNAGKLVIQGSAGTGSIAVGDGAILDFAENGSTQIKPSTLTLGTSASVILEFNNVTNTTLPPLAVSGAITTPVGSPVTININSGQFNTIGQVFPLFSWGSGAPPAVTLGNVSGAAGALSTNGSQIVLTITSTPYVWTGGASATWDTTTAGNWNQSGTPKIFANGVLALFDDTALVNTNITISGLVQPSSLTFDNDINAYTVNSSSGNDISGSTGLTMSGAGSVTLTGGANTYTGVTTVTSGGILSVGSLANGGLPSDIGQSANSAGSIVLNGGTLQYTGGDAAIDRLFSIGSAGATIDASGTGSLSLTNTGAIGLSGGGPRTLVLEGSASNLLAGNLVDSPGNGTALTKHGSGVWVLTGTNTYSGGTLINQGQLQIGTGGASGTIGNGNIVNNTSIDFLRTGTLTVPGGISGTGSVTNDGTGTVILAGNNTYSGGTTINAGTLQFGNGGAGGTVNANAPIVDNGTVAFNSTSSIIISGFGNTISGTGNVIVKSGFVDSEQGNTYTGWTEIDAGATFQPCKGQTGGMLTSVITNNGTIKFFSQNTPATFGISNNIVGTGRVFMDTANQNAGNAVIAGTNNTYSGGTWIGGAVLVLGDGVTPFAGSIVGPVWFTNTTGPNINTFTTSKRLLFNRFDDFVFTNTITSKVSDGSSAANSGSIEQVGPGMVTLTGNNSYPGDTTVDANMTMQVGNGGASGSIGTGPVVNNGTLVFNRSGTLNVPGAFSGSGSVVNQGTGTVIMAGTNTMTGFVTVSNGTLRISTMYQGNSSIFVQDGATLSVTNAGGTVSALVGGLALGNAAGPSTVEFLNVADPTTRILTAGALAVNGNSTIKITGSGGLVAGTTYPLIGYSGGITGGGTFSLSLPAGVTGTLTNDAVNSWIALNVTTATFTPPKIQGATLNGTNIVITATNNLGSGSETYSLLSSTNIASALTNWSVLSTGSFNPDGSLSITNPVGPGRRFFILRAP